MKIVIQDAITKRYFNRGEWFLNIADASEFKTTAEALTLASQLGMNNFEVLHVFEEAEHNFSSGVMNFSKQPPPQPLPSQ